MKKILFAVLVTGSCLLAGCGEEKVPAVSSSEPETTTVITVQTTTAVSSTTTEAVTTKAKAAGELPEEVILDVRTDIEVYEELTVADLISCADADILDPEKSVKTDELGEHEIEVELTYQGKDYTRKVKYNVVDTTPPLVLNSGWEPYTLAGQPFDLDRIVGFADNYDRSPVLSYSGEVNTDEVGSYPLTVFVTDSSGNETSWDMNVLVMNEIPKPADNNPRVDFSDFISRYDFGNVRYGIDVSAWQTDVDYDSVRDAGCEFAIMRMGYYYNGYDEPRLDDYFYQNLENASAAGLDIGVYLYTDDNTEEKAREHARWMVDILDGKELDFPVVFDWEEWAHFQEYGMNLRDINEVFEAFADELEQNGYSAMLYSSKNFLESVWTNRNNRPVWLAHFVDETTYTGPYNIWQQSAYGHIPGIAGDVDMNIQFMAETF